MSQDNSAMSQPAIGMEVDGISVRGLADGRVIYIDEEGNEIPEDQVSEHVRNTGTLMKLLAASTFGTQAESINAERQIEQYIEEAYQHLWAREPKKARKPVKKARELVLEHFGKETELYQEILAQDMIIARALGDVEREEALLNEYDSLFSDDLAILKLREVNSSGDLLQPATGAVFPFEAGGLERDFIHCFDKEAKDVGAAYQYGKSPNKGVVSLYVTSDLDTSYEAYFRDSLLGMTSAYPSADLFQEGPFIVENLGREIKGKFVTYVMGEGRKLYTALYVFEPVPGIFVKFRVSYPERREARVQEDFSLLMKAMTWPVDDSVEGVEAAE